MVSRLLSIKWKLTFAFVGMSLVFVVLYLVLAQKTFENDKIAYVYETQQNQVQLIAGEFWTQFEKMYLLGKSLLMTYDPTLRKLSPQGESLFQNNPSILGLELVEERTQTTLLSKQRRAFPSALPSESSSEINQIQLRAIEPQIYLLSVREADQNHSVFRIRILLEKHYDFKTPTFQSVWITQGRQIMDQKGEFLTDLKDVPEALATGSNSTTVSMSVNHRNYLISKSPIGQGDLSLYILTPESIVFSGIKDLYRKSLVFLLLTAATALLLSFFLAHAFTAGILELTDAANDLAKNHFDRLITYQSKDEIGVLANAFRNMVHKIKLLLKETAMAARMHLELETAKLVQDRLFPKQNKFEIRGISIHGKFLTASECGGDWWWTWSIGEKVFVLIADATGHGAPAALLTSAARSCLATLERIQEPHLLRIVEFLNDSIFHTGGGAVTMSAFVLEMNSTEICFVNCSHVNTAVFPPHEAKSQALTWKDVRFLDHPISPALGHRLDSKFMQGIHPYSKGERLVLLTDGITEAQNKEGKQLNDRSLYQPLATLHQKTKAQPGVFIEGIFEIALAHYGDQNILDDLTAVVIDLP